MKITFNSIVLADIAATPRVFSTVERLGNRGAIQDDLLFEDDFLTSIPRGNVAGQFVCVTTCSYASVNAAITAWKAAYDLILTKASLVWLPRPAGNYLTFANAILESVEDVEWQGVHLKIRYTFKVTTMTNTATI